ncbi:MAG: CoA-binding protein [Christensenellales bacterium]|jgi:predicted CoA-binding protein
MKKILLEKKIWAVVGANRNPEKFGNKIYKRLKEKGYEAYAVNPAYDNVEGDTCYKDLSGLPILPDVINIVISPEKALPVLEEARELNIKYVWFQPGTYDEETDNKVKELGLQAVYGCVLVETA